MNVYRTEQPVTERSSAKTIGIAEAVSRMLIGALRNWSRNVLLRNLAADPHFGPHTSNGGCTMCAGAIPLDGDQATFNVAYYALAHFSGFVRPGSVRIGSSELEQLSTAAFPLQRAKWFWWRQIRETFPANSASCITA